MSRGEKEKASVELAVFAEFASKAGMWLKKVEKREPPEPDLLCEFDDGSNVAFELVEICNPDVAEVLAQRSISDDSVRAFSTGSPTEKILAKKLDKKYSASHPVQLLCYVDGRIIDAPDMILADIRSMVGKASHKYCRVWLLAEGTVYEAGPQE